MKTFSYSFLILFGLTTTINRLKFILDSFDRQHIQTIEVKLQNEKWKPKRTYRITKRFFWTTFLKPITLPDCNDGENPH